MAVFRKLLTGIESAYRSVWNGLKRLVNAFVAGLRELIRSPGKTLVRWFTAMINGLFKLLRWLWYLIPRMIRRSWNWLKNVTLGTLLRLLFKTAVVVLILGIVIVFGLIHYPNSQIPEPEPPDQTVYLNQGWGTSREAENRQTYYYTPQGTGWSLRNMRYSWFVNLEQPWGKKRFANPDRMRAYGFMVDTARTDANPDQLPVGITKYYDPVLHDEVIDITCAACHTGGLLARQGDGTLTAIRIDGGQAMHAFTAMAPGHFGPVLLGSMASTYLNPFKFNRFARNVLGEDYYKEGKAALRREFKKTLLELLKTGGTEKRLKLAPTEEGFGRTDAIARIANMVFGAHLDDSNYHIGDAPVSYPPTWDIWKFDWVQYSGSVAQPMARNLGESLGVGATFFVKDQFERPLGEDYRFSTTTSIEDLHDIELALRKLRPPEWPENLLGEIDVDKAVRGGLLFAKTCQGCHGPHPASERQIKVEAPLKFREENDRLKAEGKVKENDNLETEVAPHWRMKLLSIYDIGTDPIAAVNFVRNKYDLTKTGLSNEEIHTILRTENNEARNRKLKFDFGEDLWKDCSAVNRSVADSVCKEWDDAKKRCDEKIETGIDSVDLTEISVGQGLNYLGLLMRKTLYERAGYSKEKQEFLNGFGALDLPQVKLEYKARPLAGMWATPPFLHNGSVHNIYELLSPAHERERRFFVGRREFDPVQLGFVPEPLSKGGFWFDVTKPGNANSGHEFRGGYKTWTKEEPFQYGVIGPEYTREERYEIIEYLKVHHDDPPYSDVYEKVRAKMVAGISASLSGESDALGMPLDDEQACNVREYFESRTVPDSQRELKDTVSRIREQLEPRCTERKKGRDKWDLEKFSCKAPQKTEPGAQDGEET
ncbi:MAG: di-heme-cytochrome C peroxidase [Woeseiaceae bacterium]